MKRIVQLNTLTKLTPQPSWCLLLTRGKSMWCIWKIYSCTWKKARHSLIFIALCVSCRDPFEEIHRTGDSPHTSKQVQVQHLPAQSKPFYSPFPSHFNNYLPIPPTDNLLVTMAPCFHLFFWVLMFCLSFSRKGPQLFRNHNGLHKEAVAIPSDPFHRFHQFQSQQLQFGRGGQTSLLHVSK